MDSLEATKIARDRWLSTLKFGDEVRTTYGDGSPKGRIVKLIDRDYGYVRVSLGLNGTQPSDWIGENWIDPPEGLLALEMTRSARLEKRMAEVGRQLRTVKDFIPVINSIEELEFAENPWDTMEELKRDLEAILSYNLWADVRSEGSAEKRGQSFLLLLILSELEFIAGEALNPEALQDLIKLVQAAIESHD